MKPLCFLLFLVSCQTACPLSASAASAPPIPTWEDGAAAFTAPPAEAGHVPGRLLVALERGADEQAALGDRRVLRRLGFGGVRVVEVPAGREREVARALEKRAGVRYAEPDFFRYAQLVPDDTLFDPYQWYLRRMGAPEAWSVTTGSDDVTIAVLDSGVDDAHPELRAKTLAAAVFLEGSSDPTDETGHGTQMAGLAAATGNNGLGVAGVSWGARILPIRVLDATGRGTDSQVAEAIRFAADSGARVLNLSLGSPGYNQTVRDALEYARARGCLVVAAAGNYFARGNPVMYPAAYPSVLSVGSVTDEDRHAPYSSTGFFVSVAAPGGSPTSWSDPEPRHWITSTWARSQGQEYGRASGTSHAAALVSGLAALLWSANPSLSDGEVRDVIQRTAADLGEPGRDDVFGWGRVDLGRAVSAALELERSGDSPFLASPRSGGFVHHTVAFQGRVPPEWRDSYRLEVARADLPGSWEPVPPLDGPSSGVGILRLWDTELVPDGPYLARLRAVPGIGGEEGTEPVAVTVDNTPPVAWIDFPTDGSEVPESFPVAWKVVEEHGNRRWLELGAGKEPLAFERIAGSLREAPWSDQPFRVDLSARPEGFYTIRVVAEDLAGNSATREVRVTMRRDARLVPGDANDDGTVDVADVLAVLAAAVGLDALSPRRAAQADVAPPGGDGVVGPGDAIRILRRVVGLEPDPWP